MSNPDLILTLGKVLIATAWVDGHVSREEINSLKDLTFHLPDLNARQWTELEMYIDSPVSEAERVRLVDDLRQRIKSPADKQLALEALDALAEADGVVTDDERQVIDAIKAHIEDTDTGIFGGLSRFMDSLLQRRSEALQNAPNREEHFEDYIQNKIYYKLRQRLHKEQVQPNLPEAELRKLCLAGGIMAQIAHADNHVAAEEVEIIENALKKYWDLSDDAAAFVAEIAISDATSGFDRLRMSREFLKVVTREECALFLDVLFQIAVADGYVSGAELEHIRTVSKELLMSSKDFNTAKRKIARDLRAS